MIFSPVRFGTASLPTYLSSRPEARKKTVMFGVTANPSQSDTIEIRGKNTTSLKTGLEALKQWDKDIHLDPVLLSLNISNIEKKQPKQSGKPYLIAVAGGSGSGKSTICDGLKRSLGNCEHLPLDNYFVNVNDIKQKMGLESYLANYQRDTPDNLHLALATEHIQSLKNGQNTQIPKAYGDMEKTLTLTPSPFVLVEGLLALQHEPIERLANLSIYLEANEKTRVDRFYSRIQTKERGSYGKALDEKRLANVLKCHAQYVQPSRQKADVVINANARREDIQATIEKLSRVIEASRQS